MTKEIVLCQRYKMSLVSDMLMILLFGLLSGLFLTLMDRIDEHNLLSKNKSFWAYVMGIFTAAFMILSINEFNFLYPLLFGLCVEWIVKNKIDYPSHVFFLFLMTFYFGYESSLFIHYWLVIALFLAFRFFTSVWLKNCIDKSSLFYRYFYLSYTEKLLGNVIVALMTGEYIVIIFGIGFAISSLQIKRHVENIKCFISSKIKSKGEKNGGGYSLKLGSSFEIYSYVVTNHYEEITKSVEEVLAHQSVKPFLNVIDKVLNSMDITKYAI